MSDRHLRILSDAARVAARRLRAHEADADADDSDTETGERDAELERSATRAHRRFVAAVRRRSAAGKT